MSLPILFLTFLHWIIYKHVLRTNENILYNLKKNDKNSLKLFFCLYLNSAGWKIIGVKENFFSQIFDKHILHIRISITQNIVV